MADIDGTYFYSHGLTAEDGVERDHELASVGSQDGIKNSISSGSAHYYVNGTGGYKERDSNHKRLDMPPSRHAQANGPNGAIFGHLDEHERVYIGCVANTTADLVSANATVDIWIALRHKRNGRKAGHIHWDDVSDRETSTTDGGIEDNPELAKGVRRIAMAGPQVPAGMIGAFVKNIQTQLVDV